MKKIVKKLLLTIIAIFILISICIGGAGYVNYRYALHEVSLEDKIASIKKQSNYVTFEHISPYLLEATVATEDRRFYDHDGVEIRSIIRAAIGNLLSDQITGGGSTITQQLAKNLYFGYEQSYIRKVSEVFLANDLEKVLSKDEILELYVNIINYGAGQFGVYDATTYYFDKLPSDLTLNEASLLAGVPQSPVRFDLSKNYENALKRQRQVLQAMLEEQMITQLEMDNILIHQ